MSGPREIWLGQAQRHPLAARRRTRLVAPVPNPSIRFFRGESFFQPSQGPGTIEVPVMPAMDKKVLGWMAKHGDVPEAACVLTVRVPDPRVTQGMLDVETPKGSKSYAMNRAAGGWECPQRFVLMYGDDGDLQGARFDGIELLDVTKSGDVPFEQTVKFGVQGHERELGVMDLLIRDADGQFRTARYGIFLGRKPTFKLVAPRIGPNFLKVVLDDADDATDDELDITKLVDPAGAITDVRDFQDAVPHDSSSVVVTLAADAPRKRSYDTAPAGGDLATFLLGENRVRIVDSRSDTTLFQANFLLYPGKDETVPVGRAVDEDETELDGRSVRVSKGVLALDFDTGAKDYDVARYLYAVRLRPRGLHRDSGCLQAGTHVPMGAAELRRLLERLRGFKDSILVSAGLDLRVPPEATPPIALEALPAAFRDTNIPEFGTGNGVFANAQPHYHHHFALHTFPAHRLIDKIRFPDLDPPVFVLPGAHFDLDKTFILPTASDEVHRMIQARKDHADRKLAIFGHTDATGSDSYNNELSKRRARISFALLTHDVDEWMKRLDNSPASNERPWGVREIQHMLTTTGHYTGPINGLRDTATRRAIRDFQGAKGMTQTGNDDGPTRRALVEDYMQALTGATLAAGDFFADPAGNPAVFGCGEAFLQVSTDKANPQNRRVILVLRRKPVEPLDPDLVGAAVPFPDWLTPESAEDAPPPDFVIGCGDTGFGLNDDLRGDHAAEPNRLFVKGRRLVRPTDVNSTAAVNTVVFDSGDLRSITDSANFHGTAVMTSCAADGVGDDVAGAPRTAPQVVLGTGKDVRFRPVRSAGDFASAIRKYEVLTADPEAKILTSSFLFQNLTGLSAAQQNLVRTKLKAMLDGGRILFIAAANTNPQAFPSERDVARTEGGQFVPDRSQKRASFTGANAFQARIATVGATNHVVTNGDPEVPSSFTYLGTHVSLACPGTDIRVVSSQVPPNGGALQAGQVQVNGVRLRAINGTSFSTPMTAGIAGEMLLVNPALKQAANIGRVIELLEATADEIPSLAAAPAAQQGRFLPGAPDADPQLTAAALAGFRRVHFWKAILAAANDGIPVESKLTGGAAATTFFTQLTGRDHAATVWYGFEIRIESHNANLWLRRADGSQARVQDSGAAMPAGQIFASTWRTTQPFRAPATHANPGFRGFTIPPLPIGGTLFMCQFSIQRGELEKFQELRLYRAELDPMAPGMEDVPPLARLALDRFDRMRDPKAITPAERSGDVALDQIATHVEEFDDFVFHVTVRPQELAAFVFVHAPALGVGEERQARLFALDRLGNLKTDFNGAVNVFHTGTAGAAGPPPAGVFLDGAPATAPVAFHLVDGVALLDVRDHTAETFRLTASDGAGHTERAGHDLQVAPPGALGSFLVDVQRADGVDPANHAPRVENELIFAVVALDADGRRKTDYRGTVELKVTEGQEGFDATPTDHPPKGGVQVTDAFNDPFDAARLRHAYTEADSGRFEFHVFNYTAGPLTLEFRDGEAAGRSRPLQTLGGALDHFQVTAPDSASVGSPFKLRVTCCDAFDNVITDFTGRVRLAVVQGTAGAVNAGQKVGVHIGDSSTAADDFHEFESRDQGAFDFPVTAYTAETVQLRASTDGGVQSDSAEITVAGAGALAGLGIDVFASQMTGVRFRATVRALDAAGRVIPTFAGVVTAALAAGTPFAAAGPAGVQIHTVSHTYVAADNGEFQFDFTAFTAETIRLQFASGGVSAQSANIQVQ